MIKVKPGHERSVYVELQKRPELRYIYRLFGEYNFFLILQAGDGAGFDRLLKDIRAEDKVIKTGPILFTADGDRLERASIGAEPALTFG
jgi:DNA-binding Lrp family transcriptional regulator